MNYIDSKRCLPHFSIFRNDMFAVMDATATDSIPCARPATTEKVSHQILKLMPYPYRNESPKAPHTYTHEKIKSADLGRFLPIHDARSQHLFGAMTIRNYFHGRFRPQPDAVLRIKSNINHQVVAIAAKCMMASDASHSLAHARMLHERT